MSTTFLIFFTNLFGCFFCRLPSEPHPAGFVNKRPPAWFPTAFSRRRRDLNPRAATNDLLPFQGSPFNHLGTSALVDSHPYYRIHYEIRAPGVPTLRVSVHKRREWDSNPRALADKRFSRPPRYDHFDISPKRSLKRAFIFYPILFILSSAFRWFFSGFS